MAVLDNKSPSHYEVPVKEKPSSVSQSLLFDTSTKVIEDKLGKVTQQVPSHYSRLMLAHFKKPAHPILAAGQ